MAPAANTARQRRVLGSARAAAESDSDAEYRAYNGRLREASAARTRLRKAQQTRDKNRTALATAYDASLTQIESRITKSVAKHKDLRSALHIAHLKRLKQAVDRRDAAVAQIARKLAEHQRRMLNLAIQLRALYDGRREDVAAGLRRMREEEEQEGGDGGGGGGAEGHGRRDADVTDGVAGAGARRGGAGGKRV